MTFAEYNTDDYFNNKDSTADGLIKAAYDEGKTREEVEKSLSPLWKEDKKGNVKKALDTYYSTPKAEEKPAVEEMKKTTETLKETPKAEEKKTTLDKETEKYMNKQNNISYAQEDAENARQADQLSARWDARLANIDKMSDSMRNVDDKLIDQLPTFMWRRYQNGEFGDPKSNDAKLRLAYFAINNVASKLKMVANADAIARGQGQIFQNTESAYDQYQASNLAQGLENRWNKYKQETQSAIDLAKEGGMTEESITDSIATISSNNRLQSAFNQMNERQKVFALKVLGEIGDKMGNMNDAEFANTLMGMSAMGDSLDYKEAAGMLIYRFIKDPEKRSAALKEIGLDGGNIITAGLGGGLLGGLGGGNSEKKETGVTLEDGTKIDPGKAMSKEELEEVRKAADKLGQDYYDGKITEEQFRKDYVKLENIMSQHGFRNAVSGGIQSQDQYLKQIHRNKLVELSGSLDELNANAKNMSKDDYLEQYENLKANAKKWGADEKQLKAMEKDKEKSLKAINKKK